MAAVTANQLLTARSTGGRVPGRVAAAKTLYSNTLAFGASGYISDDDNGGANPFRGIVVAEVDNSSGSAGDESVELITEGVIYLKGSSFTQATEGVPIYAVDNYTVQASATLASRVGTCVEYVDATTIGVKITVQKDATA